MTRSRADHQLELAIIDSMIRAARVLDYLGTLDDPRRRIGWAERASNLRVGAGLLAGLLDQRDQAEQLAEPSGSSETLL